MFVNPVRSAGDRGLAVAEEAAVIRPSRSGRVAWRRGVLTGAGTTSSSDQSAATSGSRRTRT